MAILTRVKGMGRVVSGEEDMYVCVCHEHASTLSVFMCRAGQVILPNVPAGRGGGRLM